ncbi:MAG: hypothetical protein LBS89_07485, partial [Zoogloeaceae bacterium]|jgi:phosphatidate cytidylyltransferase|nr:hypothetical protein [Zoogloeaceae bacterium]
VPALLFWCLLAPAWVARQWRLRLGEGKKALLSILGLWLILATWLAMVQIRAQGVSGLLFMLVIAGVIALLVFLVRRKFGGATRTPEDAFRQERRVALRGIFLFGLGWAVWLIWVGRGGVKGDALWILLVFVPAILLLPVASLGVVGIHLKMLLQRQANLPCRTNLLDVMAGLMAILPCFALLLLIGGQIPD